MGPAPVTACGILFCYNEEQMLPDTLRHYLSQGIDLVVFDNYSTDSSVDIVNRFRDEANQFSGKIIDLVRLETRGYEWHKILRSACDYMHQRLTGYDFLMLVDADGLYQSPVKDMPLLEFMAYAKRYGYNVLNGIFYEFYPTEKDDPAIASPVERMHYCKVKDEGLHFAMKHHKIFRYHPSVDFYSTEGHIVKRRGLRVLNKVRFIYRHYPWVSFEHGVKKIFRERKPRYVERKHRPNWHWHWLGLLPIEKDLVMRSQDLLYYEYEKASLSRPGFFAVMELGLFSDILAGLGLLGMPVQRLKKKAGPFLKPARDLARAFVSMLNALPYGSIRNSLRLLSRELKTGMQSFNRSACPTAEIEKSSGLDRLKLKVLSLGSLIFQEPVAFDYPSVYHFLMTNFCNARCSFCNQNTQGSGNREVTLDDFKKMVSNIPVGSAKAFFFSGGGEPLLCRDIFGIISYVNESFPWIDVHIRTNGLLIGRFAGELARLTLSRLEVSVHGPQETNDLIIQGTHSAEIFDGIKKLNVLLKASGRKVYKAFYPALSRVNIEQLPELVKKAGELEVDEVAAFFCRYYPGYQERGQARLREEDSLFYHKELYNEVIKKTARLARRLGVRFEHEPLFFERFRPKTCRQPWKTVVVDWDGEVYPCTGGEVWFERAVKSGRYHFGNLMKEHVYQFWNNDSYVMIRRTCSERYRESFVPECSVCPNTLCFRGADEKSGHFLVPPAGKAV